MVWNFFQLLQKNYFSQKLVLETLNLNGFEIRNLRLLHTCAQREHFRHYLHISKTFKQKCACNFCLLHVKTWAHPHTCKMCVHLRLWTKSKLCLFPPFYIWYLHHKDSHEVKKRMVMKCILICLSCVYVCVYIFIAQGQWWGEQWHTD